MNVYEKWDTSPVIVSFAEKSTPLWAIPFPAVTVCPETKVDRAYFNFAAMRFRLQKANKTAPFDSVSDEEYTIWFKLFRVYSILTYWTYPV